MNDSPPSFLTSLLGSFTKPLEHHRFANQTGGKLFLHFLVLITGLCLFYGATVNYVYRAKLEPVLIELAQNLPHISVKDGKMSVDIEQPYEAKVEGELVAIVDTELDAPDKYFQEHNELLVITGDKLYIKEASGVEKAYPYQFDFDYDSSQAQQALSQVGVYVFPVCFGLAFLWQFCWKLIQVFITAAFVAMLTKTGVELGGTWALANLALGPALVWGALVFAIGTLGVQVPFAGFIFWGILVGLTYYNCEKLGETPKYS